MNKLQVIGNITKDAELKNINGRNVINFNVAVNENYKNKDGMKVEKATFYSCAIWRESGQSTELSRYLLKGTKVFIEGKPSAETYKNKEGNIAIDMRIMVKEVELLGSKKEGEAATPEPENMGHVTVADGVKDPVDDLPF